jgi:molybdopterin-guanine dinucleotide biosynthesis protein A
MNASRPGVDVAGVVLAGGLARRMGGGDKGLRMLAGRPMLDWVVERARPQVGSLAINANGPAERFAGYGLPVLADAVQGHVGPLAGVLTGMEWAAREGSAWIATFATDAPFLPRDLVARMLAAAGEADIVIAASGGRTHPVFGLWRLVLADDLRAALREGTRKIESWTARHRVALVTYPTEPVDPFFNANAPEDLAEAERVARVALEREL